MLTTRISEEDYKLLETYFNNYCMIMYNRHYPITDNNIEEYFKELLINVLCVELETDYLYKITSDQFWIDGYYLIGDYKLFKPYRLGEFDNIINERINK